MWNITVIGILLAVILDLTDGSLSCDFEQDFCDWLPIGRWNRTSTVTPDVSSGPERDHTSGSGFYAYISSSHAGLSNGTGALTTPVLLIHHQPSLTFWYHMNGVGIGALQVRVVDSDSQPSLCIWEVKGRQGTQWQKATVLLPNGGKYRVSILATSRLHFGSDIAIDDIVFHGDVREIPPTTTEEPILDITDVNCNFENSFCHWRQESSDQFDWKRTSSRTPDKSSGPSADHTTGTGFYAFINGEEILVPGWKSKMVSPRVRVKDACAFTFWYQMNGRGVGSLIVRTLTNHGEEVMLFKVTGGQGPDWLSATIDLLPGVYKLEIEGTALLHYGSDIAVDDIHITSNTK